MAIYLAVSQVYWLSWGLISLKYGIFKLWHEFIFADYFSECKLGINMA